MWEDQSWSVICDNAPPAHYRIHSPIRFLRHFHHAAIVPSHRMCYSKQFYHNHSTMGQTHCYPPFCHSKKTHRIPDHKRMPLPPLFSCPVYGLHPLLSHLLPGMFFSNKYFSLPKCPLLPKQLSLPVSSALHRGTYALPVNEHFVG